MTGQRWLEVGEATCRLGAREQAGGGEILQEEKEEDGGYGGGPWDWACGGKIKAYPF